ncbi:hypothetical protein [Aeromicrobium piscarium]|uniref:Uncharacterized protein n=1 Tax=Aeromicrobium piscarium TaxID=2590901 RepID=A0A554SNU2_9ACTN|nr:hypothetical protein [Aeromicrobium piscarium]TSD68023.1 hypothetical protein FNM00_00015 [Aeromicrobium piscarium]
MGATTPPGYEDLERDLRERGLDASASWPADVLASLVASDAMSFVELALAHVLADALRDSEPRARDREPCDVRGAVFAHRLDGTIYATLAEAFSALAWAGDPGVERWHVLLAEVDHDAVDILRCRMLAAPSADSDTAVEWLVAHPDWYSLGWGSSNWPPMDVVAVHADVCSMATYEALEQAILEFLPAVEEPACRGFGQYELLAALGDGHLSSLARDRLVELHHRFAEMPVART